METVFPLYPPAQALKQPAQCGLEAREYIEYRVKHGTCEYRLPVRLFYGGFLFARRHNIVENRDLLRYNKRCNRKTCYLKSEIRNLVSKLPVQALLQPIF